MLDLNSDPNIIHIDDPVSGGSVGLYYRTPTTEQLTAYSSKLYKRKGKKLMNLAIKTRVETAKEILVGLKEGDFGLNGKPISSDPESPDFHPDWLALLEDNAAHILAAMAFHIFEYSRAVESPDEDDQEATELPPLPFNSGS